MQILLNTDPFARQGKADNLCQRINTWPAKWVKPPFAVTTPARVAFRCRFEIAEALTARLHISADERYQLFLDGRPLGRGPAFGDQENWYFDTYDLALTPGEHVLVARVLMLGAHSPAAQISLAHGLVVCPDPESPLLPLIATGAAPWSCKLLPGFAIGEHSWRIQATGPMTLDTREFPWGCETGGGEGWTDAIPFEGARVASAVMEYGGRSHLLRPTIIPPQLDRAIAGVTVKHVDTIPNFADDRHPFASASDLALEHSEWNEGSLTIPANCIRRVLLELDDYYSFFYALTVSGGRGSRLRIAAAERLFDPKVNQPDRPWEAKVAHNQIEGSFFAGPHDEFILDGGANRTLESYWWRCGRFVQIIVATGDQPLTLSRIEFRETRYPLEMESRHAGSDPKWSQILSVCFRTLQECCHEIFVDCPYYEQAQWVGDMRVQMLCHYVATRDVRQIRKALALVDNSAAQGGFVRAYYPSDSRLLIPGFALWHIAAVHDLALWRGEKEFVQALMPQARATMDAILQNQRADGLLAWPQGWPYTDWADGFPNGNPPAGESSTESIFNFHAAHVLDLLAELETYLGENELAERWRRKAKNLADACGKAFWDEVRGLFAIDLEHRHFSEHSQCLAVLGGRITSQQQSSIADKLISDTSLTRVQLFYSHYLFEAYRRLGRMDALFLRLEPWHKMLAMGLKTTPETVPLTRSDCHAWSAHPLFHFYTTVLGIRPSSMGFATVEITPQLGQLGHASGKMVHPRGFIEVEFHQTTGKISGSITLPDGLIGTALVNGRTVKLQSGTQKA
jgi:alpha-L-rhamnosidase